MAPTTTTTTTTTTTGDGKHPLLIDVVLETIFQYVPDLSDLKTARLVCSPWRKSSLKQWRQAGALVLFPKSTIQEAGGGGGHASVDELVSLMMMEEEEEEGNGDSSGFELGRRPYQGIRLNDWKFYGDCNRPRRVTMREERLFKERLAGFLTYLHLDCVSFQKYSVLDELLTRNLPNLRRLVMSDCKFLQTREEEGEEDSAQFSGSVEEFVDQLKRNHHNQNQRQRQQNFQSGVKILQIRGDSERDLYSWKNLRLLRLLYSMPNLEEVFLRIGQNRDALPTHSNMRYMNTFLSALKGIKDLHNNNTGGSNASGTAAAGNKDNGKFRIRNLDIMDFFTDATFEFWNDWANAERIVDLGLERLAVDVGAFTSKRAASDIFSSNSETLKVLQAFRAPVNPASLTFRTVPFTVEMSALEELHLWGNFTTNLEFLKYTPNLKTLVLKSDCFDKRHKLKSLLKDQDHYLERYRGDLVERTLKVVRRHRRGIPAGQVLSLASLVHLDIDYNFSARTIPTLARWLPNVRTLKMVLTNRSLEAVSRAWPNLTELEPLFGSKVDNKGISYLLQLSNLKKFKSNAYCNEGLLSSSSVDQVFLKMKTLKSLEICVSSEMSVNAEMELTKNIAHAKVIRNYDLDPNHHHHHPRQECCDRLKFLQEAAKPVKPKSCQTRRNT